jgi:hypothetical protein
MHPDMWTHPRKGFEAFISAFSNIAGVIVQM